MGIRITTLMENSLGEHSGLSVEHGLSFLIETATTKVLFDTGRSGNFLLNAEKLKLDLAQVEHVVLSHGHYDHTGGLRSFINKRMSDSYKLWVGNGFFRSKLAKFGPSHQYLGNDFDEEYLKKMGLDYEVIAKDIHEIAKDVWLVTNFLPQTPPKELNPRFVVIDEISGEEIVDDFHDEVLLVLKTENGLVVLVGCSHPGILSMIETVAQRFSEPIYALLGGTHLIEADDITVTRALADFKERGIALLGISHCTGERAVCRAEKESYGFFKNCTGTSIIIR
jgi:7,8-dihydropterin-6-yl-methyl-4-(beta-D-ribofuranosyl)aminobenzene 5'-phosphate synthase